MQTFARSGSGVPLCGSRMAALDIRRDSMLRRLRLEVTLENATIYISGIWISMTLCSSTTTFFQESLETIVVLIGVVISSFQNKSAYRPMCWQKKLMLVALPAIVMRLETDFAQHILSQFAQ